MLPDMDGTMLSSELFAIGAGLKPKLDLALDGKWGVDVEKKRTNPRASGQHKMGAQKDVIVGEHSYPVAVRFPTRDRRVKAQTRAVTAGERQVRLHTSLRKQ